jgi:chromosome segregation ATPase
MNKAIEVLEAARADAQNAIRGLEAKVASSEEETARLRRELAGKQDLYVQLRDLSALAARKPEAPAPDTAAAKEEPPKAEPAPAKAARK